MSIKSQKSLNDECSEIFERSYSCKSGSEESLSDDDEESLSKELLKRLTPAVLSQLRRCFKKSKEKAALDIDRRVEEVMRSAAAEEGIEFAARERPADPLSLDQSGFVAALRNIFGSAKYSAHAAALFRELDPLGGGRVRWRRLLARLVDAGAGRVPRWAPVGDPTITRLAHCQVFNHKSGDRRRVKNCWITDAEYMSDAQCLVLASSARTLAVFDAAAPAHSPLHRVTGVPDIPTCLAYCPESRLGGGSELIFGTERGDITRLRFLHPRVSLLPAQHGRHQCGWRDLSSPVYSPYCSTATWRRVHRRAVKRVWCDRDGGVVLSCSHDAAVGLRLRHASGLVGDYEYSVQRGVTCFHVVPSLQLIATGSPDGIVRMWGTTGGAAHAKLVTCPAVAVLDVAVAAADALVIAYCNDCIIKVKFPFLGALGKKIEFGPYSIHSGPAQQQEHSSDNVNVSSPSTAVGRDVVKTEDRRHDFEYARFDRCSILVSCCDCVCSVPLRRARGPPLPAPGDTLRARRPSHWDLPADFTSGTSASLPQGGTPSRTPGAPPATPLNRGSFAASASVTPVTPAAAASPAPSEPSSAPATPPDLDDLLDKAGLQGILEKDFVLMRGLKHELHNKLHQLAASAHATQAMVALGAPHLALDRAPLLALPPPPCRQDPLAAPLMAAYDRICRTFLDNSSIATSTSEVSTPRHSKIYKL